FGSARTEEGSPGYVAAREFAHAIAAQGWMVITGAGPGIMAAGHEGAGAEHSFGANTRLPFLNPANVYIARAGTTTTVKSPFYRNYQSARFVGERLVLRLRHAPDESALSRIRTDFADLLEHGDFEVISATSQEVRDNDEVDCERLAFYPVHAYGRLRQLIDAL